MSSTLDDMALSEEVRTLREEIRKLRAQDTETHKAAIKTLRMERIQRIWKRTVAATRVILIVFGVSLLLVAIGWSGFIFGQRDYRYTIAERLSKERLACIKACDIYGKWEDHVYHVSPSLEFNLNSTSRCWCHHCSGSCADEVFDKVRNNIEFVD
jgi:hypothetical protein